MSPPDVQGLCQALANVIAFLRKMNSGYWTDLLSRTWKFGNREEDFPFSPLLLSTVCDGGGREVNRMLRDVRKILILSVFLLIFLIASPFSVISKEVIKDEETFIQKFSEALKIKDQARMKEVVRQGEAIVYKVVMSLADNGMEQKVYGEETDKYFKTAEIVAKVFGEEFGKEGLLELVKRYTGYTLEMCQERQRGGSLFKQGNSFYEKSKWQEALKAWTESLKIYKKIGDVVGESKCLGSIGNVYDDLGRYKEALEYYSQSLEISRRIGDVVGESKCITNIAIVYYHLGHYIEALE